MTYDIATQNIGELQIGDIINCSYSGTYKELTLPAGEYKLECWGAEGGQNSNSAHKPGKGGYSIGIIDLLQDTKIYLYTGGKGNTIASTGTTNGGFNGGGNVNTTYGSYTSFNNTGGGASDIRINSNSLYARVIVAGGGGGGSNGSSGYNATGGYGGGTSGGTVTEDSFSLGVLSTGGTQTSGGAAGYWSGYSGGTSGSFGQGGSYDGSNGGAAGGGGWYGGGGGAWCSGGGGSGYVYTSATVSNYPSGCLLNSSMYLASAQTMAGNTSFPSTSGSTETGHSGNGYVRITVINIFQEEIELEPLPTPEVKNEIKILSYNFSYTGSVQSMTLQPGIYKLECWGARGGLGAGSTGGLGGYSCGTLTLSKQKVIYVYAGGAGNKGTSVAGGFNGGGHGSSTNSRTMSSGGGASDIRIGQDSLYARIIVAGGGGGGHDSSSSLDGGVGGGISGGTGKGGSDRVGYGGTQTSGGAARTTTSWDNSYINTSLKGSFGQGGGGYSMQYINGAGGGWYGGGAGGPDGGAGGGSGYVYTSSTAANYPSGCLLDSSMYLTDAQILAGDTSFPAPNGGNETGHSGDGYVRITSISVKIVPILVYNFLYTGKIKNVTLPKGVYKFECWGAQGGTYSSIVGGKGGYSKGILTLENDTNIYIRVGGQGSSLSTVAGFNGGGVGTINGRGGGGASDIRINEDSLYSRIIVAGGGGGAGISAGSVSYAGCGGGTYGGDGYSNDTTGSYTTGQNRSGGSASQTAGGISWNSIESTRGTFGKGGNAYQYSCGGGGGGWYGGGGAYDSDSDADGKSGGGGSGYVYTAQTQSNYPQGCLLNSDYYLEDAETIAGNTSFPATTSGNETGHTGDGYVRITYMLPSCFVIKVNGFWKAIDIFMKNNGDIKRIESVSSLINKTWKNLNI